MIISCLLLGVYSSEDQVLNPVLHCNNTILLLQLLLFFMYIFFQSIDILFQTEPSNTTTIASEQRVIAAGASQHDDLVDNIVKEDDLVENEVKKKCEKVDNDEEETEGEVNTGEFEGENVEEEKEVEEKGEEVEKTKEGVEVEIDDNDMEGEIDAEWLASLTYFYSMMMCGGVEGWVSLPGGKTEEQNEEEVEVVGEEIAEEAKTVVVEVEVCEEDNEEVERDKVEEEVKENDFEGKNQREDKEVEENVERDQFVKTDYEEEDLQWEEIERKECKDEKFEGSEACNNVEFEEKEHVVEEGKEFEVKVDGVEEKEVAVEGVEVECEKFEVEVREEVKKGKEFEHEEVDEDEIGRDEEFGEQRQMQEEEDEYLEGDVEKNKVKEEKDLKEEGERKDTKTVIVPTLNLSWVPENVSGFPSDSTCSMDSSSSYDSLFQEIQEMVDNHHRRMAEEWDKEWNAEKLGDDEVKDKVEGVQADEEDNDFKNSIEEGEGEEDEQVEEDEVKRPEEVNEEEEVGGEKVRNDEEFGEEGLRDEVDEEEEYCEGENKIEVEEGSIVKKEEGEGVDTVNIDIPILTLSSVPKNVSSLSSSSTLDSSGSFDPLFQEIQEMVNDYCHSMAGERNEECKVEEVVDDEVKDVVERVDADEEESENENSTEEVEGEEDEQVEEDEVKRAEGEEEEDVKEEEEVEGVEEGKDEKFGKESQKYTIEEEEEYHGREVKGNKVEEEEEEESILKKEDDEGENTVNIAIPILNMSLVPENVSGFSSYATCSMDSSNSYDSLFQEIQEMVDNHHRRMAEEWDKWNVEKLVDDELKDQVKGVDVEDSENEINVEWKIEEEEGEIEQDCVKRVEIEDDEEAEEVEILRVNSGDDVGIVEGVIPECELWVLADEEPPTWCDDSDEDDELGVDVEDSENEINVGWKIEEEEGEMEQDCVKRVEIEDDEEAEEVKIERVNSGDDVGIVEGVIPECELWVLADEEPPTWCDDSDEDDELGVDVEDSENEINVGWKIEEEEGEIEQDCVKRVETEDDEEAEEVEIERVNSGDDVGIVEGVIPECELWVLADEEPPTWCDDSDEDDELGVDVEDSENEINVGWKIEEEEGEIEQACVKRVETEDDEEAEEVEIERVNSGDDVGIVEGVISECELWVLADEEPPTWCDDSDEDDELGVDVEDSENEINVGWKIEEEEGEIEQDCVKRVEIEDDEEAEEVEIERVNSGDDVGIVEGVIPECELWVLADEEPPTWCDDSDEDDELGVDVEDSENEINVGWKIEEEEGEIEQDCVKRVEIEDDEEAEEVEIERVNSGDDVGIVEGVIPECELWVLADEEPPTWCDDSDEDDELGVDVEDSENEINVGWKIEEEEGEMEQDCVKRVEIEDDEEAEEVKIERVNSGDDVGIVEGVIPECELWVLADEEPPTWCDDSDEDDELGVDVKDSENEINVGWKIEEEEGEIEQDCVKRVETEDDEEAEEVEIERVNSGDDVGIVEGVIPECELWVLADEEPPTWCDDSDEDDELGVDVKDSENEINVGWKIEEEEGEIEQDCVKRVETEDDEEAEEVEIERVNSGDDVGIVEGVIPECELWVLADEEPPTWCDDSDEDDELGVDVEDSENEINVGWKIEEEEGEIEQDCVKKVETEDDEEAEEVEIERVNSGDDVGIVEGVIPECELWVLADEEPPTWCDDSDEDDEF